MVASSSAASSPLLELWWEKHRAGLVSNDPDLLVLHRLSEPCGTHTWGTVFYSKVREEYKARLRDSLVDGLTTFDVDLMNTLKIGRSGGLLIAANPNSILPGHLILYPENRRAELLFQDLEDLCALAATHTQWTFFHNMEDSAASVIDWAHFQALPVQFPIAREIPKPILQHRCIELSRLPSSYPAYGLVFRCSVTELLADVIFRLVKPLAAGFGGRKQIPWNLILQAEQAWLLPRSSSQSKHAAGYIGALEMGGLFCLPNAENFQMYLRDALREEVRRASVVSEPDVRDWFEGVAREVAFSVRADR